MNTIDCESVQRWVKMANRKQLTWFSWWVNMLSDLRRWRGFISSTKCFRNGIIRPVKWLKVTLTIVYFNTTHTKLENMAALMLSDKIFLPHLNTIHLSESTWAVFTLCVVILGFLHRQGTQSWYDETKYFTFDSNKCADNEICGHYTQVGNCFDVSRFHDVYWVFIRSSGVAPHL